MTPFSGDGQHDAASSMVLDVHSWPSMHSLGPTVSATPHSAGMENVVVRGPSAVRLGRCERGRDVVVVIVVDEDIALGWNDSNATCPPWASLRAGRYKTPIEGAGGVS